MQIVLNVLHVLICIGIIVLVLFQQGKQAGLSGSISGGAETFFGKNKARTMDSLLKKITSVAAIGFLISSLALQYFITK